MSINSLLLFSKTKTFIKQERFNNNMKNLICDFVEKITIAINQEFEVIKL